ncbi:MAG: response regulator [Candidatus Rokubacteria bacterium]|nr:response regulator [Candidatus Rokubacteria bacterium]
MESTARARILVVDDEPEVLDVLAEALAADGYPVATAADGLAALDRIAAEPFDVVVTDLVMPGLSGLDVAESVKRTRPSTGVILITAWGETARRARVGTCPVDFMLTKPFDVDQVRAVVKAIVRSTPAAAPPPPARPAGPRVLLVEDDPIGLRRVTLMLESAGCRVDTAPDGRRGVALACARPYDLILVDCRLPDGDGLEAVAALRRSASVSARAPLVGLEAGAAPDDRERWLSAGMDDHVATPLAPDELARVVGQWTRPAPILDPTVLARLRDLDEGGGLVEGMIERFLRRATEAIGALRHAAAAGDSPGLVERAQGLAREGQALGAFAMADLCRELEALARADSVVGTLRLVDRLEWELGRVQWMLQRRELTEPMPPPALSPRSGRS